MRWGCLAPPGPSHDFTNSSQLAHTPTIYFLAKENVCYLVLIIIRHEEIHSLSRNIIKNITYHHSQSGENIPGCHYAKN